MSRSRLTPTTTPTRIPRRGSWSSSPRSCLGRTRGRARGRSTVVRREDRGRRLRRRRRVRRRRRRRRRVRRLRGRGRPRDRRRGGHRRSRGIARDETRVSEPREAREAREDLSIERTRLSRSTAPSTTPTPTTWCGDECPASHVVSRSRRCDTSRGKHSHFAHDLAEDEFDRWNGQPATTRVCGGFARRRKRQRREIHPPRGPRLDPRARLPPRHIHPRDAPTVTRRPHTRTDRAVTRVGTLPCTSRRCASRGSSPTRSGPLSPRSTPSSTPSRA